MTTVAVAHCRAGFEGECAADLCAVAQTARLPIHIAETPRRAFVAAAIEGFVPRKWERALLDCPPIFARSVCAGSGPHPLPDRDRVTPLIAIARQLDPPFSALWLEVADTNEGKTVSAFSRRLAPLLEAAASSAGLLARDDRRRARLHLLFSSKSEVFAGTSTHEAGSDWPMGIPRLKMPRAAPSRSSIKLAEALFVFLDENERTGLLRPGMRAVDLGAAPGGWTWQLAERGLRVTAVDNASLRGGVRSDPLVDHVQADGLKYRPRRPVDWMVCDIVEKPSRIAALVGDWVAEGRCRRTIFNLKLPMKKRYDEVRRCEALIRDALDRRQLNYSLRFKQLYHDREEVTGYCERVD
jgi:23S rRNA (cytidine2498-2'-O)-methyltransferase